MEGRVESFLEVLFLTFSFTRKLFSIKDFWRKIPKNDKEAYLRMVAKISPSLNGSSVFFREINLKFSSSTSGGKSSSKLEEGLC